MRRASSPIWLVLSLPRGCHVHEPPQEGSEAAGEEAGGEEFAEPEAGEVEQAEVSATPDALAAVPATLLEVKAAIEQQLTRQAAEQSGAASAESYDGAGNIQAVYARLADTTIREQWERAQKINIRGEPVDTIGDGPPRRRRVDETKPRTRENGAAQRLLRPAATEVVPARQRPID